MTAEIFIGNLPLPAADGQGRPDFPKLVDLTSFFSDGDSRPAPVVPPEVAQAVVDEGLRLGEVVGEYQITGTIAEGGCSTVYCARTISSGKAVALKLLRTDHLDVLEAERERLRFKHQIQMLSRIRHPNVVRYLDSGRVCPETSDKPTPYLVTEYLAGETLATMIEREGPLSVSRTVSLALPVLSGLQAAHNEGVVHRDITPSNILMQRVKFGALRPTILDFGVANSMVSADSGGSKVSCSMVGSPPYMSPEQAKSSSSVCPLTDQYSMAVVIYECLTGRRPCEARSTMPLLLKIACSELVPPRAHNPLIPRTLEHVLMRALSGDPRKRFPSILAFGRALLTFADVDTVRDWSPQFWPASRSQSALRTQ